MCFHYQLDGTSILSEGTPVFTSTAAALDGSGVPSGKSRETTSTLPESNPVVSSTVALSSSSSSQIPLDGVFNATAVTSVSTESNVGISQATFTLTRSSTVLVTTESPENDQNTSGGNFAVIAAGVTVAILVVVAAVIAVGIAVLLVRGNRKRRRKMSVPDVQKSKFGQGC